MGAAKETTKEIEHLKKQIAELTAINENLAQSHSEGRFASTGRVARTMAHEIRNPLTNINLAVEQLISESPAAENTRFLFDMISRNSKRINQIISDLLASTRFSDLNLSPTSISEVLEETLVDLTDVIQANNIEVVKNFDPAIKEVTVDRGKMKEAFLNLLTNAAEAMAGKDAAVLQLVTEKRKDKLVITISDNGKGMDEEDAKKVFEPYFTKKQSGLGLSLTSTQNIILNNKGIIKVKTKLGEGTTFTILLNC